MQRSIEALLIIIIIITVAIPFAKPIHFHSPIVNFHCRSSLLKLFVTETLVDGSIAFCLALWIILLFATNDFSEIKCYFKRIKFDLFWGERMMITQYIGKTWSVKRQTSGMKLPYELWIVTQVYTKWSICSLVRLTMAI